MRIGSRTGYAFGLFPEGIDDEDLTEPMGNINLRNLTLTSNNPGLIGILMLGGLRGVSVTNVRIDGDSALNHGIYYEFGFWHMDAVIANRESSHASGLVFRNVFISNLSTVDGSALALIGCEQAVVENLHVDSAFTGFTFRPGEALFYNVGTPYLTGVTRRILLRNIICRNMTSNAIVLNGSESSSGGYLSGEGLSESEQVDLMAFSVDGFNTDSSISCTGPLLIRNGTITGGTASGGLILGDECVQFEVANVRILDGADEGVRANIANGIWAVPRQKVGVIRNCLIAGNAGIGVAINQCRHVLIENNRFGYEAIYDGVSETTQTSAVNAASAAFNVMVRNNHVNLASGTAYVMASGSGPRGNVIAGGTGTITRSGLWKSDLGGVDPTDSGDADRTIDVNSVLPTVRYATTLTVNRTVTISTTGAYNGAKFRIVRTGLGAFTLDVGGLKTIPADTAAFVDVEFNGSAWILTGYGTL